jgi:heat shock protein HtpX
MYSEITANKRKTVLVMLLFLGIIGGLLWIFSLVTGGDAPFITIGVMIGALIYTIISYFAASRVALAVNGAHKIEKRDNPRLWRVVENLAITEGLPMPDVYIMNEPAPNAFATGRDPNHASVCATTGLLDMMTDSELEGVMAHELGHIKNYDIRVSMIAFGLVAVIGLLADVLLRMTFFRGDDDDNGGQIGIVFAIAGAILAPLAATLIQLAISRQREYLADATGAMTTRYPEGLASALEKIGAYGSALKTRQNASTAHLFFANPLSGKSIAALFSTHPPVGDRVSRLQKMGRKA